MKMYRSLFRQAGAALIAAAISAPAPGFALAGPGGELLAAPASRAPEGQARERSEMLAQGGGCYAIAQSIAAQHGGAVARADAATRGGQSVCVIVVVVPARDGQRGRRLEFTVPQN